MQDRLKRALDLIVWVERAIVACAFTVMLVVLLIDVAGRELFGQGLFGSVRIAVYALILCAMAGFGLATATGGHLRPKFLDGLLAGPLEGPGIRLGQLLSAAIMFYLAYAAVTMVQFTRLIEERDLVLDTLVWPIQTALPIGFALSGLRHLIYAIYPALAPVESSVAE